jgi:hypothetical protein
MARDSDGLAAGVDNLVLFGVRRVFGLYPAVPGADRALETAIRAKFGGAACYVRKTAAKAPSVRRRLRPTR